ncbi:MAG: hypothetical protein H6604_06790 [Flavobacteriales bacterium]|nr:hypothetical protein [Flavobacteriales bacterium]
MELLLYTTFNWPIEKFLGFVYFLITALTGFWCLKYLIFVLPYWLTYGIAENNGKINADVDPETVRRKKLYEQENIQVIFRKEAQN